MVQMRDECFPVVGTEKPPFMQKHGNENAAYHNHDAD